MTRRRTALRATQLEARDCPAVFQFDYSLDAVGYFTPARRALVDFAAQAIQPSITDTLAAITPDPANNRSVSFQFRNRATGQTETIDNPTIAADTIRVYMIPALKSDLSPDGSFIGFAGAVGADIPAPADQDWINLVNGRGQAGAIAAPATDVSLAVAYVFLATDVTYYEDTAAPPAGSNPDFVALVEHELMHPLGFAEGEPAMTRFIVNNAFTGAATTALVGGVPVPLTTDGGHFADGTTFGGAPASQTPTVQGRLTDLDRAVLKDIGWETAQVFNPGALGNNPNAPAGRGDAGGRVVRGGGFAAGLDSGGDTAGMYNTNGTARFTVTPVPGFTGGLRTASGDVNADGIPDLIVGTGPGRASLVQVYDGRTQAKLFEIAPFEAAFLGGVFVSAGDINGDGTDEVIVTPDQGGGPRVTIYKVADKSVLANFFGIDDPNFRGGARATAGDVNGDRAVDLIVAAGFGGGPRVAVFSGAELRQSKQTKLFGDFFIFGGTDAQTLRNGVFIAAGDVNGDGFADLVGGGGPGGGPRVLVVSGRDLVQNGSGNPAALGNFFAGDTASRGGIRVTTADLDGDGRADLVVGAGAGSGSRVTAYLGPNVTPTGGTPTEAFKFDAKANFGGGVFVG